MTHQEKILKALAECWLDLNLATHWLVEEALEKAGARALGAKEGPRLR